MPEFIPKAAGNLSNLKPEDDPENTEEFTPMQQRLGSQDDPAAASEITEFKSKEAIKLSTPAAPKTESLKNIQTPSQGKNPDGPTSDSGDTPHKANVKIVRDGDKITQIFVVCNCGETIPLDCIY